MSTAENQAVFLSYASQDAAAVLRIAEALRASGVEVWFDKDELVGGDAWDQKIRRQIKECALFVPVISANTQARLEGYFRLEWKLGAQRTHTMAAVKTFLLPVVIDDTRDSEAHVPEEFCAVQWTRLPEGDAGAAEKFCARVGKLLGGSEREPGRPRPADRDGGVASPASVQAKVGRRVPAAAWIAAVAVVCVAALYFALRPEKNAGAGTRPPTAEKSAVPVSPATEQSRSAQAGEKSVAVMAFENLSDDKTNEYFSEGISEELLNVLAKIPGLKVSARTSAFYFKGKEVPIPEIAKQLGVAYVVEGSVRKAGDKVRIAAQLIKAADGFHVWSDTFTRDLKDVFAVQDEIARLVAKQLSLKLGTSAAAAMVAVNPETLTLLLEARYYWNQRGEQNFDRAEALLNRALAIEPTFARAHSALADVWLMRASYRLLDGGANVATELQNLRANATRASELDPTLVDPVAARAYGLMFENRMEEAGKLFGDALGRSPDNPTFLYWRALYLMNQGEFHAARRDYEKSRSYDPMAFIVWQNSAECALALGNYDEGAAFAARAHEVRRGGFAQSVASGAMATWLAGRRDEAVALARSTRQPELQQLPWIKAGYAIWVLRQAGLEAEAATYGAEELPALPVNSYQRGFLLAGLGRFAEAHPYLENMPPYLYYLMAASPIFDPWREEPQFKALVEKLNWPIPYAKARATRLETLRR